PALRRPHRVGVPRRAELAGGALAHPPAAGGARSGCTLLRGGAGGSDARVAGAPVGVEIPARAPADAAAGGEAVDRTRVPRTLSHGLQVQIVSPRGRESCCSGGAHENAFHHTEEPMQRTSLLRRGAFAALVAASLGFGAAQAVAAPARANADFRGCSQIAC